MMEIGILGIFVVLLWIGWELHRIAQLAINFMRGFEEGHLQRQEEIEQESEEPSLVPKRRDPNPDMTGWTSAQKSQNP
jgi:hypothetical protein